MSSSWFGKLWNGAGAIWSWGLLVLFFVSLWTVGSLAVHYFQGSGLNGVYEASDGFGYVTFWPNGIYQTSGMGLSTTSKYEIERDGSVDMLAQYKADLHPGPNASSDAQATALFGSMIASGMGTAILSTDKNTVQWQGHTYSYYGKPTTGSPAVADPTKSEAGIQPSGGQRYGPSPALQMHTPTPQEINQSLTKPGDPYTINTTPAPNVTDPNQIGGATDQDEWGPNSPKMQQYYQSHPNMVPPASADPGNTSAPSNVPPPTGVIMPDDNLENEIRQVH